VQLTNLHHQVIIFVYNFSSPETNKTKNGDCYTW